MIWLVSQLWPVALVSVLAGFVITWFSITRRYNPATDPERPKRHRAEGDIDDNPIHTTGDDGATRLQTTGSHAASPTPADDEAVASPEPPRQVGVELRSPRSRNTRSRDTASRNPRHRD